MARGIIRTATVPHGAVRDTADIGEEPSECDIPICSAR
jgi:hypothetical protein